MEVTMRNWSFVFLNLFMSLSWTLWIVRDTMANKSHLEIGLDVAMLALSICMTSYWFLKRDA